MSTNGRPSEIRRLTSLEERLNMMSLYGMTPDSVAKGSDCSIRTVYRVLNLYSARAAVRRYIIDRLPEEWTEDAFFAEEPVSAVA